MPPIYGDPTDLIILWAVESNDRLLNRQFNNQLFQPEDAGDRSQAASLHVQVLNGLTGKLIGERRNLNPSPVLRCVHDAGNREIRLETRNSVIAVDYAAIQDTTVTDMGITR